MALALIAALLWAYMTLASFLALAWRDNGIADIAYGGAFILLAASAYMLGPQAPLALFLTCIVSVWALRLSYRITRRHRGKPEDFRYAAWRAAWGRWFVVRSYVQIYLLQGAIASIIAAPVVAASLTGAAASPVSFVAGFAAWLIGFAFEVVGDAQLDRFVARPEHRGMLMTTGLWRYSRHPNYFGEALMWWGIAIIACGALTPAAGALAFLVFASPVLITFLLLKVSGVPLLEAKLSQHPAWDAYARATNAFVPWFPHRAEPPVALVPGERVE